MAESVQELCKRQREALRGFNEEALRLGDTWYLVDTKWFKQWKTYVGFDKWDQELIGDASAFPGPIDNSPLLQGDGTLKEHLVEDSNFTLLSEPLWNLLVEWYGLKEEQQPIARKVIDQGVYSKNYKVEIYLIDFILCHIRDLDHNKVTKSFSASDTLDQVVQELRTVFNIADNREVRISHKYMSKQYELLPKWELTIRDSGLFTGQVIVVEEKNGDGSWPMQLKQGQQSSFGALGDTSGSSSKGQQSSFGALGDTSGSSSKYAPSITNDSSNSYDAYSNKASVPPGLCGLSNLGNTCFMNSAVQCMSNVPALTEYMLRGTWKLELNKDNPLGMRGEVATTYAELIKNMWCGKHSSTVPRHFKIAVGRFKPEFSGYQQQDSQELMAFLLDGLHEDLNRIRKKPYVELKEAVNRPDEEVARETWQDYTRRNNSVIVDIFHGLLKSTLVCPQCNKISVKFDPFCYLSVPLPVKKERQIEVFFVPLNPAMKLKQCKVTVPKMGLVSDLCTAMSVVTKVPWDHLVVADVYNHRFHKVFAAQEMLSHIADRDDIFVYEVPVNSPDDPDTAIIPVYMREVKEKRCAYTAGYTQLFGQPLLVPVPRNNCVYDVVYNCVLQRMSRYVRVPAENEWPPSQDSSDSALFSQDMEEHNEDACEVDSTTDKRDHAGGGVAGGKGGSAPPSPIDRRIFSFQLVNSYGNTDIRRVLDDGSPIVLGNHTYLAADWSPKAKDMFYDEKESELIDVDESMEQKLTPKKAIHLTDCLELFTTMERLGEQDPWYCPDCQKHQQATKKFDIWQLPNVLVFHLKRFSYSRYWRDKLDTFIDYPTRGLDMSRFVINPNHQGVTLYDLIAVSNHYGGMGGGHYTAYAKNKDNGQWYNFDDSSVSSTTEQSVVTKAGYVLVYQRRGSDGADKFAGGPGEASASSSVDKLYSAGSSSQDTDMVDDTYSSAEYHPQHMDVN